MAIYLTISQQVVQDVDVFTAGRLRDVFGTSTSATPSRSRRLRFFTFSSGSKKKVEELFVLVLDSLNRVFVLCAMQSTRLPDEMKSLSNFLFQAA